MTIDDRDRPIIRWAMQKAYSFDYCRQNGLPDPCLRVRLGLTTAYFQKGKLVHWRGESPGDYLDQLTYEMSSLFAMCSERRAYMNPRIAISPAEEVVFRIA